MKPSSPLKHPTSSISPPMTSGCWWLMANLSTRTLIEWFGRYGEISMWCVRRMRSVCYRLLLRLTGIVTSIEAWRKIIKEYILFPPSLLLMPRGSCTRFLSMITCFCGQVIKATCLSISLLSCIITLKLMERLGIHTLTFPRLSIKVMCL